MNKVYSQEDLGECKICHTTAVTIVTKRVSTTFVLFSYCEFHAELARQYFGESPTRNELKGFKIA